MTSGAAELLLDFRCEALILLGPDHQVSWLVRSTTAPPALVTPTGAAGCQDRRVDVLTSRILLRPTDLDRSHHFYRDVLGLAIYREFGSPASPGLVFFLGPGFLEVSGHSADPP